MTIALCGDCNVMVVTQDHNCKDPKYTKPVETEHALSSLRIFIKMYEQGWNDALDSLKAERNRVFNPLERVYKMLLDEGQVEPPVTKPDLRRPSGEHF